MNIISQMVSTVVDAPRRRRSRLFVSRIFFYFYKIPKDNKLKIHYGYYLNIMDKIQSMFSMSDLSSVKIHIFIYPGYTAPRTTRALIGVLYTTQCYHHHESLPPPAPHQLQIGGCEVPIDGEI